MEWIQKRNIGVLYFAVGKRPNWGKMSDLSEDELVINYP